MNTDDDEYCGKCRFYRNVQCKLGPPVYVLARLRGLSNALAETHYEWKQPVMLPNDWCGQFKPKQGDMPAYPPNDIPDQKTVARRIRSRNRDTSEYGDDVDERD